MPFVTDHRGTVLVDGAGHWVQQERPPRSTPRCSTSSPASPDSGPREPGDQSRRAFAPAARPIAVAARPARPPCGEVAQCRPGGARWEGVISCSAEGGRGGSHRRSAPDGAGVRAGGRVDRRRRHHVAGGRRSRGAGGGATLAGSLQSELGCAADWDPACATTTLAPRGDGTWSFTATVPAGSFEWKVALDGGWARSYPAANVPLVLTAPVRLTFTYDDAAHRVAVAPAADPAPLGPADEQLAGTSLRTDLTRERFYFVMADRFANGDPSNDDGGLTGDRLVTGLDPTHKGFYHGGDIAGVMAQLDYLAGLGTTAIWLTPSFKNRPCRAGGRTPVPPITATGSRTSPRSTPTSARTRSSRTLVDAAHDRGIKVFFDIITNHTADVIDYAEGQYAYIDKATAPYLDAAGNGVRRPRLRRRHDVPRARHGHVVPVHALSSARRRTRRSRSLTGSTTRATTTTAATRRSPASPASTATSSASTTCSPSSRPSSPG